jgi:hypothetical protein
MACILAIGRSPLERKSLGRPGDPLFKIFIKIEVTSEIISQTTRVLPFLVVGLVQ